MDMAFRDRFLTLWKKHFNGAELPITFFYTDDEGHAAEARPGEVPRCIIGALNKIRRGQSLAFSAETVGCPGGKKYLGFAEGLMPNFEYFLSCGIPGKMEGERYKKTPEMVKEYLKHAPSFRAPAKYIVFKRWDKLDARDQPEIAIFYAEPDVLAGLFTLASFDEPEQNMVIAPFGSGCSTIVQYPLMEAKSARPRAVIGMFDVSARPFVPRHRLTFAAPMEKVMRMVDNMEESFLITPSWEKVKKRLAG